MTKDPIPTSIGMDDGKLEEYILLVLSDSNLPTGGFVASSGLESYWAHGLLQTLGKKDVHHNAPSTSDQLIAFISASLDTYGHTIAAFLMDTHKLAYGYMHSNKDEPLEDVAQKIEELDLSLHSMMLNHVAQRASKAQGVALLTLFAKSFSPLEMFNENGMVDTQVPLPIRKRGYALLQALKTRIRRGTCHGHLPICWAAFMAALGIQSPKKSLAVHLFLQARAILSSAVRLNIVGPYLSHRLLAFDVRRIIEMTIEHVKNSTTSIYPIREGKDDDFSEVIHPEFEWNWQEDDESVQMRSTPKTTWPLGDLLQGRHDQLHSRLFNS